MICDLKMQRFSEHDQYAHMEKIFENRSKHGKGTILYTISRKSRPFSNMKIRQRF